MRRTVACTYLHVQTGFQIRSWLLTLDARRLFLVLLVLVLSFERERPESVASTALCSVIPSLAKDYPRIDNVQRAIHPSHNPSTYPPALPTTLPDIIHTLATIHANSSTLRYTRYLLYWYPGACIHISVYGVPGYCTKYLPIYLLERVVS